MEFLPDFNTFPDNILFFVFAIIAFLHLLFVILIHGKLAFYRQQSTLSDDQLPGVSVIIAARNEADNLFENLPMILEQDYPEFEVIVINHQSVDETAHLLSAYQRQYPHLHVIEVARNQHLRPGKKLPITLGVKGARYEHMILTDADCKPAGKNWIRSMSSRFVAGKEIVLGYGPYNKKKGFLNRVIRFDTAWIAVNYFSMALARLPYMGVGRNLAYTKDVFIHVKGFRSHYALPSGDDDLFIQEAAKKKNYTINLDPDSYCYSDSSETWGQWKRQKTRHYSTSSRYKVIKKSLLGIYPFTLLILAISFVILMFSTEFRWITLAVFGVIFLLKWWIQGRCLNKIGEKAFILFLPFWDLFYAVLIPLLYFSGEKKKMKRW
jgi:cellulose synthase/poly-beta-1,6-N-acetylglucosamine synthase-like glycosyltransferase